MQNLILLEVLGSRCGIGPVIMDAAGVRALVVCI